MLFVHAVNPHGFSYGRRVNEDNVDLNRNFRDFAEPPPVNAAYAEVHPLLLPATWPPPQENEAGIGAWIAPHGERAFQAAVTGGQYAFPDGLFYGGARPDVEQPHVARRCCGGTRPARHGSAGSISTPGSARAATAKRSTPAATRRRRSRACARTGGAPTSRRSTTARRRRRRSPASCTTPLYDECPGAEYARRSRSNTGPFRCARSSRRCAPITGCTIIPSAPQRCARDPAADARRVLRRRRRLEGAGVRAGARGGVDGARAASRRLWRKVRRAMMRTER